MKSLKPSNTTRVLAEDQEEYNSLAISDETIDGINYMTSVWEPTPEELAILNEGGAVHLTILGVSHPPVILTAKPAPEKVEAPSKPPLPPTHSAMRLSEALRAANLPELADAAANGEFHDYLSPHPMPDLLLSGELYKAYEDGNLAAGKLRERHYNGEFDATKEESDQWANEGEGKNLIDSLPEELKKLLK